METNEERVYDPLCDSPDVALRAVAQKIESDRHDLLETAELDWQTVRSKVDALTMYYGSFYSRRWYSPEMMQILRQHLPELIPVAESWRVLYLMVTLGTRNKHKSRSAA